MAQGNGAGKQVTGVGAQCLISTGIVFTSAEVGAILICTMQARELMGFIWSKMKLPML